MSVVLKDGVGRTERGRESGGEDTHSRTAGHGDVGGNKSKKILDHTSIILNKI